MWRFPEIHWGSPINGSPHIINYSKVKLVKLPLMQCSS